MWRPQIKYNFFLWTPTKIHTHSHAYMVTVFIFISYHSGSVRVKDVKSKPPYSGFELSQPTLFYLRSRRDHCFSLPVQGKAAGILLVYVYFWEALECVYAICTQYDIYIYILLIRIPTYSFSGSQPIFDHVLLWYF